MQTGPAGVKGKNMGKGEDKGMPGPERELDW